MKLNRPTCVDLFSGAGLFSYAFQQAGFAIERAIELDPVAAATYARNVGDHIEVADVRKTDPNGRCDVLIAGPPCQGFSTLNRARADDPRNRLSYQVLRWSRALRPKVVVIENVSGFLESPQWRRIVRELTRDGFHVDSFILDAFNYGCPQYRRRSFTIANSTGAEISPPRRRPRLRSVREAWDGLPLRPNNENHHYAPAPSDIALARMRCIPPGGDKRDVMAKAPELTPPSWWRLNCEVTDAWGRMEWDKPCNTLRTALQNASKGRYIHPEQDRVISLREAARLHTIPDTWVFEGLPTQISRQIGNSVPPALGRAIARMVFRALA
jgi:DNA (cytosine-5)-methyltransferase 1